MKRILITGATGFIGNHLVEALLQKGQQIVASSSDPAKAMAASWYGRVEYRPLDLRQLEEGRDYFSYFDKPDSLVHLTWEGLPNYKSAFHLESNLPRHSAFIRNMVTNGLRDVTVTGTCYEYGMQEGCLREDMPVFPNNPYAQAKNELRVKLETLQRETGMILRWVRLFYMFGKGQNPNSLLSQLDRALDEGQPAFNMSGGEQVRDYLPVEKVAEYLSDITLQQKVTGIINCCSGEPITVKELVNRHLRHRNKHISLNLGYYPYPDYEPMRFWGDNGRLKTILNDE